MTGIDCVSFLALIQLLVAFDLGLFYLDENHQLTKFYQLFRQNLHSQADSVLSTSKSAIEKSAQSSNEKCRIHGAYLIEKHGVLSNIVSGGKIDFDGWAFLGLYGGIYGLICMFFVGLFKCEAESFAQMYILICAQIIIVIQATIILRMCLMSPQRLKRNILHNTFIILGILIVSCLLSFYGLTIKIFAGFELPFVISMIIVAMPIIAFIGYVLYCQIRVLYLKWHCTRHIKIIRHYIHSV